MEIAREKRNYHKIITRFVGILHTNRDGLGNGQTNGQMPKITKTHDARKSDESRPRPPNRTQTPPTTANRKPTASQSAATAATA